MCYPSPGPRCSGHTGARLKSLNTRLAKIESEMVKCNAAISRTLEENEGGPSELVRKQKRVEKLTTANNKNYEKYLKVSGEIKSTQRDYDGTPVGQKKLQEVIDNPESTPKEVRSATNRLQKAKAIRSWRMNHKIRMERQKNSTQSVGEEKRRVIFLNDPKTISFIDDRRAARKEESFAS